MSTLTPNNVIQEVKNADSLAQVLTPKQFAEPDKGLADKLAQQYLESSDKLKATQLRRFFHAIKAIVRQVQDQQNETEELESKVRDKLLVLLPELAYARGRELIPQEFYDLMKTCLSSQSLKTVGDLRAFDNFLTALMAYHKYREKK